MKLLGHYHCKDCDMTWQKIWEKTDGKFPTYEGMRAGNPDCNDCKVSVLPHCLFLKRTTEGNDGG